jgi:2-polyprenyl-6-methoxyphenol hydroxylase-like FAD-dependent oxidoreductase
VIPVLIVGAGPVGLALAIELGSRGVACTLIEQGEGRIIDAKMFATGIRTLEFCRRWGIAERVRDWGFPRDFPFDNVFVTALAGHELARIPMPSIADTPPIAQSPENFAHCPQFVFDRILADKARALPTVTLRFNCRLESFVQDGEDVEAKLEGGEALRAAYVVGCDGYSSTVRRQLGIAMRGDEHLNRAINIMFRTPRLSALHDKGNAGRYVLIGAEGPWASLTAADGREQWRLMLYEDKLEPREAVRQAVGRDFEFEILTVGAWVRRNLVAERYRSGRVFLAGDAVHVMPPNGGLGMNTGIADAVDLGWKLAALIQGCGGEGLLASYEAERRPAGLRACQEAMKNFERLSSPTSPRRHFPHIHENSPEGRATRDELGRKLAVSMRSAWDNPLNTHLGCRYGRSPVCIADGAPPPEPEDSRVYVQSSHPGGRAPHAWLSEGRSTLDLFGDGFTLLRFSSKENLSTEARRRGVPLQTVDIDDAAIAALYERRLVLVRPDGHVAWRGDALPGDAGALLDRVTGAFRPAMRQA